jgi:imidazoleglycerol phosphate synthase glutamine amidotransferase subunit HisH
MSLQLNQHGSAVIFLIENKKKSWFVHFFYKNKKEKKELYSCETGFQAIYTYHNEFTGQVN